MPLGDQPLDDARRARIARVKKIMAPVRAAIIVGMVMLISGAHRGGSTVMWVGHLVLFLSIVLERLTVPAWVEGWRTDRRSKGFLALSFMAVLALSFAEHGRWQLWQPAPGTATALMVAGLLVLVAGAGLRQWSIRTLGRFFTDRARLVEGHELVTHGPFRWVRHPAYSGLTLIYLGYPVLLGSLIGLVAALVLVPLALRYRIRTEESLMAERFGGEWEAYAARTPALLPWPRPGRG